MPKTQDRIKQISDLLIKHSQITVSGVTQNAQVKIVSDLLQPPRLAGERAVFWFVDDDKVKSTVAGLRFWFGPKQKIVSHLPNSAAILALVAQKAPGIFVLSKDILAKQFPSPDQYSASSLILKKDGVIYQAELLKFLEKQGFELADTAAEPGYYARRGAIIEIFSPGQQHPIRIELNGNQISRLETFDPKTKKTIQSINEVKLLPASPPKGKVPLTELISDNPKALIIRDDAPGFPKTKARQVIFRLFAKGQVVFDFLAATIYYGNWPLLRNDLEKLRRDGYKIIIYTPEPRKIEKQLGTAQLLKSSDTQSTSLGFIDQLDKEVYLTQFEIIGPPREEEERGKIDQAFISALKVGHCVVHLDHGIARFVGMRKHEVDGGEREYYVLEYAEGDRLSVPVEYADKLDRYIGKANPTIHRLHGASWHQAKRRIRAATRAIAGDLLKLYALRQNSQGHRYLEDTPEQIELERSFKYDDTPGQRRATEEIKRDMESTKLMDRLLVGDVGYGKTEISIRAAFKAVQSGKQVAFLCPTTILAEQHYQTYSRRLKNFPMRVEVLSRFKTKSQQTKTIADLKAGLVDIVIGTHRLLSKDLGFKNLGLIIVDEEQRFGVEHKERLKKKRDNVDILAMTATPIPRTLHFSLAGLRDISTIDTPPPGRQPIDTHIEPLNTKIITQAITREIDRGGQIYFLHNRVETIAAFAKQLQKLVPKAKIGIGHGQLPEKQLNQIMEDFYQHKYDVLVCSTIIESGLDIKNVNTLIADEATKFGLSQLYQLRGRIGRGDVKAHAYFFYHSKKLKGKAKDRLQALLEAKELGAGFKIAMRDLEIRGTGNLLGREQHGSINAVGLNLYSRLLHQAVEELKTDKAQPPRLDVTIDLPLDAYIPDDFFSSTEKKLRMYQELAIVTTESELHAKVGKLITSSRASYTRQDLPRPVQNLATILEIKLLAQKLRILSIDTIVKKQIGGEKTRFINLNFAEALDYQAYNDFLEHSTGWERRDDRTVRIEIERLGKPWLPALKKFLQKKLSSA